jgi:hypothetical protein
MSISATFSAGQTQEFYVPGDFFRLLDSTGPITVEYYDPTGKEVAEAVNVLAGYGEGLKAGKFGRVRITSASAQTIQFVIRDGAEVRYDRGAATVTIANTNGAFTQAQRTVTNASTQLQAANAARRYLLIQNRDTTGIVYVNVAGAAATVAGGIQIDAGGSLELQGFVPTGQINAIGSIASNANVIVVEG